MELTKILSSGIDANSVTPAILTKIQSSFDADSSTLTVPNLSVTTVSVGNVKTNNLLYANGTAYSFASSNAAGSNTQVQFNNANSFAGSVNLTFDTATNTLTSTNFAGNGNGLSNITGANVSGQVANALVADTVYTNAQPNITSVGTLTGLISNGVINFTNASNVTLGAVGNVRITGGTTGQYLQTDGSGTLSWSTVSTGAASNIANGNSNVNIPSANGNVNISAVGNANVLVVTGTGANINGYATISGNVTAGNISTSGSGGNITGANVITANTFTASANITANTFTASANITAQYYIGNGSLLTGIATSGLSNGNSNINIPSANGNILVTVAGNANIASFTGIGLNVGSGSLTRPTNVNSNSSLYVVSNADAPPITIQNRFATGYSSMDIINSANVFMGAVGAANPSATTVTALANRAYLYGATGASGVGIYATTGNVTISAASNANIMTITGTGANVSGTFNVTGNANVGNLGFGSGNIVGTGVITGGNAIFGTNASAGLYTFPLAVRSNTANNGSTFGVMNENPNGYSIAVFYNNAAAEMGAVGFANPSTPYFSNAMYLYSSAANGLILSANIGAAPGIKNLWITNAGLVTVPGTTAATSTTSGAFQVTGGAGIGGNLFTGNANLGNAASANYFIGNFYGTANSATTAGTVTTAAQPNITSVGTLTSLSVTGDISGANLVLSGNLIVSGTTTTVNSTVTRVVDPILEQGGGANGAALSSNDSKDRGSLLHYYTGSTATDAFMGWDNSNAEFAFGSNVSVASEVVTFNSLGNVRAGYFIGNGSQLIGTTASTSKTTGALTVAGGLGVAGTAYTNRSVTQGAYGNIILNEFTGIYNQKDTGTSLIQTTTNALSAGLGIQVTGGAGNGSQIYSTGNLDIKIGVAVRNEDTPTGGTTPVTIASTGIYTTGIVNAAGNINSLNANLGNAAVANFFVGSGAFLTSVTAVTAGTVTTNSQPNITSVGTLTSLIVGNATVNTTFGNGTITATGNISFTGANISLGDAGNLKITGGTNGYFLTTDGAGNLSWGAASGGGGGVSATGSNTQLQFNDGGALGASANLTFNKSTNTFATARIVASNGANLGSNVANVYIGGGSNNQILKTDGSGNLSWIAQPVATITVDNFTGDGTTTAFTLTTTPTNINQTAVNYNGTLQLRSAYTVSGTTLTFSEAPVSGALIEVTTTLGSVSGAGAFVTRSYTGNGVQTTFSVTSGCTVSSVIVTENGLVQTPTTDYTISGGTLTFNGAPADGIVINIRELAIATAATPPGMTWNVANSNITMTVSNGYFVDTSGGAKTMTLPASATLGDTIRINDLAGSFATNNLTVARNGHKIQGVADDLLIDADQSSFGLVYSNSTYGWKVLEL